MKLAFIFSMLFSSLAFSECLPAYVTATYQHNATDSLTYCGSIMKIESINASTSCREELSVLIGQNVYFANGQLENGHDCVTPDLGAEPQQLLLIKNGNSLRLIPGKTAID